MTDSDALTPGAWRHTCMAPGDEATCPGCRSRAAEDGHTVEIDADLAAADEAAAARGEQGRVDALPVADPVEIDSSACEHEWSEWGSGDLRWRECWLCGTQGPYRASFTSPGKTER